MILLRHDATNLTCTRIIRLVVATLWMAWGLSPAASEEIDLQAMSALCQSFDSINHSHPDDKADSSRGMTFTDLLERIPTTFLLDDTDAWTLLPDWKRTDAPAHQEPNRTIHTTTWAQPESGLQATLRCAIFHDPPALETRWSFHNTGDQPSATITQVNSVDLRWLTKERQSVLWSASGGTSMHFGSSQAGFQLQRDALTSHGNVTLEVHGGRSSAGRLPIFYIDQPDAKKGYAVALGWSGNWKANARFEPDRNTAVITTGVQPVHFRLPPGQKVDLPTALIAPYQGDLYAGANTLRKLLREHYQGRLNGKPVLPPVSFSTWFVFSNDIHDRMLRELATEAAPLGIEYFCIDAGWFQGSFPTGVGSWVVNKERFPDGLNPVADHVHGLGMKLGLWFEPERVAQNTLWHQQYPELMLAPDLLDLSKQQARKLILDMMSGYINELDVNWIRYDFNTNPLAAWTNAEGDDEQGLKQILYINGLYILLDELMERHPDLLIEQCSSGGLRIDLETIRHGHTYWKSDDTFDQQVMRFHQTGANHFLLAGHLNTNYCHYVSQGEIVGLFAGALGFGTDFRTLNDSQKSTIRRCITAYKKVRPYLNHDYYPLFPQDLTAQTWNGWQFHDPARQEGCFTLYRPADSPYPTATITLRGLEPETTYHLEELLTGKQHQLTGSNLMTQRPHTLEPDSGQVWRYTAQ